VALFGFSANPPTGSGGHVGIVEWLLEARLRELDGRSVDEVWVLPVYRHPFAEKRDMPPFEDRLAMARLAFEGLDRVHVSDVERRIAEPSNEPPAQVGTIDIVRHLRSRHPGVQFVLVLGQDAFRDLLRGRWKESRALWDEVPIVAVRRPGEGSEADGGYEVPGLEPISSTEVRSLRDLDRLRRVLPAKVADYIARRGLYGFGAAATPPSAAMDEPDGHEH